MSSDLVSNWGSRSGVSCVRRNEGRRNARAVPRRDRAHRTGRDRLVAPPRAVQREPGSRGSCGDPGEGAHRERGARTLSRTAGDASPWGGSHRRQARGAPGAGEGPAWQPGLRLFQQDQTRKSQTTPEEGRVKKQDDCNGWTVEQSLTLSRWLVGKRAGESPMGSACMKGAQLGKR